jgi:hypothetical protein
VSCSSVTSMFYLRQYSRELHCLPGLPTGHLVFTLRCSFRDCQSRRRCHRLPGSGSSCAFVVTLINHSRDVAVKDVAVVGFGPQSSSQEHLASSQMQFNTLRVVKGVSRVETLDTCSKQLWCSVTNSKKHSHSPEANSCLAGEEVTCFLWNPIFRYRVRNLNHISSGHTLLQWCMPFWSTHACYIRRPSHMSWFYHLRLKCFIVIWTQRVAAALSGLTVCMSEAFAHRKSVAVSAGSCRQICASLSVARLNIHIIIHLYNIQVLIFYYFLKSLECRQCKIYSLTHTHLPFCSQKKRTDCNVIFIISTFNTKMHGHTF